MNIVWTSIRMMLKAKTPKNTHKNKKQQKQKHNAKSPKITTPQRGMSIAATPMMKKTAAPVAMPTTTATRAIMTKPRKMVTAHTTAFTAVSTPMTILKQAKRGLFIQTQDTPNPRSLKFLPGKQVLPDTSEDLQTTAFFDQSNRGLARKQCPLAYTILLIEGVMNVMLGSDFITVTTKDDHQDWMLIKPEVYAALSDAFASDEPILKPSDEVEPSREQETLPGDEEAVGLIKEIIDLRIRPTVMEDGGDVEFIKFDKDRVVWLLMKGSCSGCPSSGATLKNGIQNMIMHYVPEVVSVEEWKDESQLMSDIEFKKLEEKLAAKKH